MIQLEFNGRDDLTKVIDPRTLSTTYGVTGLSDVTTQTSPDTGVTTRTFDVAGNVKTSRDARGRTTTYTYDALHRLTQAAYGDSTLSTYVYDQGANGVGRLTSMTDPGPITTSWTYTAMGRVATKVQTIGTGTAARTHQLSYSYNPTTGQLISMTYPSGKVISYTYGATSKDLERIAINGANAASAITYHPFGGVKRMTLGNSQVWSNSLDQDGRVRTYTLAGVTYTLAWDAANRITGITSSQTATNRTFGYDNLDRITSFTTTGRTQGFTYDATGNLLTKSDLTGATLTNYTFNIAPTSNRMTGISNLGIGFSFDAAGNRTGDGRITYAYNYRGRLNQVRIINGATTNTYNYLINGINLRVRKTGPSTVVPQGMQIFVYDDAARLIGEYDDLGRARIEHVWLEDRPIAAITYTYVGTSTTPATTTTSYVETDHLATPRLITNASRQKRWTWESAPYGDTFPNENPQALGAYKYNLRFPGQYFDAETNHHYNHHRDYESTSGRYLQSDPIGVLAGVNTYAYSRWQPLRYLDSSGLCVGPFLPYCLFLIKYQMELYIAALIVAEVSSGVANPVTTPVAAAAKGASQICTAANQSEMLTGYLAGAGGRWGGNQTRQLNHQVASFLEQEGAVVLNGAGRGSEFHFPGPGGGSKGGTYSDIFGEIGGARVHVQTQTMGPNGLPIRPESAAVSRIRVLDPSALILQIPK